MRLSSSAFSSGLLIALLLVVGFLLAALGSTVLLPQGRAVLVVVVLVAAFLGLQLLIFRGLGLRSRADEDRQAEAGADGSSPSDEPGEDWRAWRG